MPKPPPPQARTNVKTRGACAREAETKSQVMHPAHADKLAPLPLELEVRSEKLNVKNELRELTNQVPKAHGSLKMDLAVPTERSDSKKSSNKSSSSARRKQLELAAAEAKAKIEMELIDKRLAAELAALDDDAASQRSRCTTAESFTQNPKHNIEKWLDKSRQEPQMQPEGPAPSQLPLNCPPGDVHYISQAMENLAVATRHTNTQLLARLATPKDLPTFSGEPLEWLQFRKYYEESTKLCQYGDSENIARLSKCLRGEAKEAVSSLLISGTTPSVILEALELRFGRPELIIYKIASQFKKLPPLPITYHTEIVNFAVKVKNYVAAAQSINQTDYLRSPELLNTVISKCPSALINKWVDYVFIYDDGNKAKLQIFSEFLHKEATKIAAAGISYITSQPEYKTYNNRNTDRKVQVHSVLNNDDSYSEKCKLCRTTNHPLTSCVRFKRALRKDRWRIVKMHRLCHKCLMPGHGKESCPAASCDVDECGLPHHRLLHWPPKNNSAPRDDTTSATNLSTTSESNLVTNETIANTTFVSPSASVMLKIVRVNVYGPKGVIRTHALLDDGATVSLISADLADSVNLTGQSETLRIRGAWDSAIVCHSEIVNFRLSNNNNQCYEVRARKISELDLPVQKLSKVNIDTYEHLRDLKDSLCCYNVKPKLLIGQDNFQLLVSLKTVYRGKNEPCATLTPLGWCVHGIVPTTRSGHPTTALTLTTTLCDDSAPDDRDVTHTPISAAASTGQCQTHTGADAPAPTYLSQQYYIDNVPDNVRDSKYLHELVRESFAFDSIGVNLKARENKDNIRATEIIDNSARLINGRWEVCLPWKNDLIMPDSYPNAHRRFLGVERKMSRNKDYASRYRERITHLFENDFARELPAEELPNKYKRVWYLPHFGVDNPNKCKLRLVFDAAATTVGTSLNDYLLQGPDLLQTLFGIMLRFREKPVAFIGDIKDMFLRIKIRNEDQHALRWLWRDKPENKIKTYAMTSLIFGANCSPFIAQYIKNKNALRFNDEMPEAVEAVLKSHYMDDYIESVDDETTATKLISEVSEIHRRGGFQIRNWTCNKPRVLEGMQKENLSKQATKINIGYDNSPERTLGLLWYPSNDTLGFDLSLKRIAPEILDFIRKPTKRELLSIVMSIFDIFGFLAPITVRAKIMLQSTWKSDLKWDESIHEKEYLIFRDWITTLKKLQYLRIPRWLFCKLPINESDKNETHTNTVCQKEIATELHVFCDASPLAYTAVAYWRKIINNESVCVSFIACKCRASPINKYTTIPKLELQSAVIACRLAETIVRESRIIPTKKYYWTDSLIVLHQIKNNTRNYKVFVANRLGEIDDLSRADEWYYVPSAMNIADVATKMNTYELHSDCEWFRGPQFLYTPRENWPNYNPEKEKKISDEILQVHIVNKIEKIYLPDVPDPIKFSSWLRLWRCMGYVFLFVDKCRKRCRRVELTCEIMQRAEIELLRYAQMQSFERDIYLLKCKQPVEAGSKLRNLTPFLDERGLLRVGGRIQAAPEIDIELKHPVILDGRHPIAKLLVKHYHEKTAHGNNEMIVNEMRQRYWLLHLRPTVRSISSRCLQCRIRKAKPVTPPRMGDLPEARLAHHKRPFTYCGVDLFGPMDVTVGRRHEKRYGVLFTCLTVRAIHIETVPTLSADSFIMALRRMAARRGWPYRMYSDNGTNFRGADSELKRSLQEINLSKRIRDDLVNNKLEWHFISPASPHMGGAWERLIRSVKTALKTILKERAPREEVLSTLLTEVENMVNGRPLTHVSVDPADPESLTPNHFLIGSSSNLPVPGVFDDGDIYSKRLWRTTQRLADLFWQRWVREVLPTLLPRSKWYQEGFELKKGDVVIIVDPNLPRNTWPKGIIQEVHPGADGRVRIVDIRTKTGTLTRPATRLVVLPTTDIDCPERTMGGKM